MDEEKAASHSQAESRRVVRGGLGIKLYTGLGAADPKGFQVGRTGPAR